MSLLVLALVATMRQKTPKSQREYARMSKKLRALQTLYTQVGRGEWWWMMDESLQLIVQELSEQHFCVIDSFLQEEQAGALLRDDILPSYTAGRYTQRGVRTRARARVRNCARSVRMHTGALQKGLASLGIDAAAAGALSQAARARAARTRAHAHACVRRRRRLCMRRARSAVITLAGSKAARLRASSISVDTNSRSSIAPWPVPHAPTPLVACGPVAHGLWSLACALLPYPMPYAP